ncbi:MAG TPA: copper amine oxidase N-terminal domain-containing protein, partial [Clostridia bacterium]|nr:copper amine oxidase N-terminal domain-containing protein [Clostridia bacterium]
MKDHKIFFAALIFILIAASSLTGCDAGDKLELLNALEKSANMNSWESSSQVRFTNVTFDTNIEDMLPLQLFVPLLDNLSFEARQKVKQSTDRSSIKMRSDISIVSSGLSEQTSIWADYDFERQPPAAKQVIKLPASIAASLPEDLSGKEYFVMDQRDLPSGEAINPQDYTEMLESMKNFQSDLVQLLKEHALNKDPGFVVIKQLKDQIVNGEKMSMYQLKLDDKSFKTVLKYALSIFSENEQAKNLIGEFISMMSSIAEGTEAGLDIAMAYSALTDGDARLKDEVDLIAAALEDVTMLGSRGIEMNFLINGDGYIVNQNGVFDLYINSQQVEDAFEELAGDTAYDGKEIYSFSFGMAMEFNTDTNSINQNISIDFPVITEENSFDFNDFAGIAPSFGQNMLNMGSRSVRLDFSSTSAEQVYPVKLGNNTFIPLEPISKKLGLKLEIKKNGEFALTTDKGIIKGKAGSTGISIDDRRQYLPLPVMKIENQLFVPDQFVRQCLNKGIYFDEKTKTLII